MPAFEYGVSSALGGGLSSTYYDTIMSDRLATIRRWEAIGETLALTSGVAIFSVFTAEKRMKTTEALGAAFFTGGTAAATVTTIKYGLYEQTASDTFTLRAITANDATLLAAADTRYFKAFTTPWEVQAGRRYALAVLVVATTMPTLTGSPSSANFDANLGLINAVTPVRARAKSGLADLTTPITSTAATPIRAYAELAAA